MANTIQTNSLAELVTARAAESAYYFTVGSKKYFKDQLVGKRNGQTYRFVIRDVGGAYEGLSANVNTDAYVIDQSTGTIIANPGHDKINITERELLLTIRNFRVLIETNAIETITDIDWDPEIAEPNGQKLANKAVKAIMESDFGKVGTCFVGHGFSPMSRASAHLSSITTDELFGFCDPNVEAILTSNGQQFVPVSAPDMYSKGLLGKFHGAEYRSQRFFPSVSISTGSEFDGGAVTVTSYTAGTSYDTIVLGATTLTSSLKKGTPIFIEGVYATDTVGDPTSMLHAFVVLEDATASSNAITIKVPHIDLAGEGTKEVAKADGSVWTTTSIAGAKVSVPEDGIYYMGIVRAPAAFEFETLDKLDAAGADYEKVSAEGLNVHKNQLVDLEKMINYTRFDLPVLAGTVEPRLVSMFLIK